MGLPTFKEKEIEGVCEACQFGQTTSAPISKRQKHEKRPARCDPLRRVGTNTYDNIRRMSILCHIRRRLFLTYLDLSDAAQEGSVHTLPTI